MRYLIFFTIFIVLIWVTPKIIAAQETATSNSVTTKVGNPAGGAPSSFNFVYYCQGDPKWQNNSYECSNISKAGCGPTSLAMVLSSFGVNQTPADVASTFTQKGWSDTRSCHGSFMTAALQDSNYLPGLGFEVGPGLLKGSFLDLTKAKSFTNPDNPADKYLIVGSSDNFPLCHCGHIFVVESLNITDQTVVIRDPNNCSRVDGIEATGNRVYKVTDFIWKYAFPIRKVR